VVSQVILAKNPEDVAAIQQDYLTNCRPVSEIQQVAKGPAIIYVGGTTDNLMTPNGFESFRATLHNHRQNVQRTRQDFISGALNKSSQPEK